MSHWATARQAERTSAPTRSGAVAEAAKDGSAILDDLMAGNKRFMSGRLMHRDVVDRRRELVKGQKPGAVVLGCSDSRLSPEILFDKSLGDLFVVRSAGHVADAVALGSIEYAIEHLGAKVLIVLGHEKCGAVAAASEGKPMPTKNLQVIVDRIGEAFGNMRDRYSSEELKSLGIPMNVYSVSKRVVEESPVLKEASEHGHLKVVPAMYRLESGEVVLL